MFERGTKRGAFIQERAEPRSCPLPVLLSWSQRGHSRSLGLHPGLHLVLTTPVVPFSPVLRLLEQHCVQERPPLSSVSLSLHEELVLPSPSGRNWSRALQSVWGVKLGGVLPAAAQPLQHESCFHGRSEDQEGKLQEAP